MRVITPPAVEPITLAEVKGQLGIQILDTDSDDIILRRITEARQWAEEYMQRALNTQTLEIRIDDFPREGGLKAGISLPFPNLLTVVSVKYIDINGTLQTVSSANYVVDTYAPIGFVRPVYAIEWPVIREENNAVRIQYTCGYGPLAADVPVLIKEGLHLLVGHLMNKQGQSENGVTLSRVPYAVRDIFNKYSMATNI